MTDTSEPVTIPERAFFKASEVCDLAKVQPYVLRSWEAEFKDLGVPRSGSTGRVYRRVDVERVLRIKHLLLVDGLTLAGVRRKLEEEAEVPLEEWVPPTAPGAMPDVVRERIGDVKRGLRSLLAKLEGPLDTRPDASLVAPVEGRPGQGLGLNDASIDEARRDGALREASRTSTAASQGSTSPLTRTPNEPLTPDDPTTPAFDFSPAPAATAAAGGAGKSTKRGTTRATNKTASSDGVRSS